MKKSYGYSLLMVFLAIISTVAQANLVPTVSVELNTKKVVNDLSEMAHEALGEGPDRVTPDMLVAAATQHVIKGVVEGAENAMGSGPSIEQRVGKFVEEVVENSLEGGLKGVQGAAKRGEFGRAVNTVLTEGFSQGADGFANAAENKAVRKNIHRGTKAWADTAGEGVRGFKDGFKENVTPHIAEIWRDLASTVLNWRNVAQYGSIVASSIALPAAGYYGSRVFWNVLEKRLTNPKPEIIVKQANPKFGRWDRARRWWAGYTTPPMIFDQLVKDRLTEIENKTVAIRDLIGQGRKMTYDNLLLYGKPGTGKTLFAQILADKTDMDFLPVTAASLLQSGVEGIKYFNELLELANHSKYGVIIFVDEADALFIDRNTLSPESDHYKVLNHILALTGTGSNKFMLIAATNHSYVMDEAMGRRFQDRVLMPLPNESTRLELLNLYCATTLFNVKENSSEFVSKAQSLLTASVINQIVQKTDGLSHAEIKDMIATMNKTSQITTITADIIKNTVDQAVEKHKVLEEEKAQREAKAAKN